MYSLHSPGDRAHRRPARAAHTPAAPAARRAPDARAVARWVRWLVALMAGGVLLLGCGGGGDAAGGGAAEGGGGQTVVAQGEDLYARHCAGCHGSDLQGTAVGPPMIHEYYLPLTTSDEAFATAINEGASVQRFDFGPMPAIPGLSEEQVDAIIAYVRQQQREAGLLGQ